IMQADSIFYSAVAAFLHLVYLYMVYNKVFLQHLPGRLCYTCHIFKTMRTLIPQPFIHLVAAECLIAMCHKKFAKLFFCKRPYIFLIRLHGAKLASICQFSTYSN